MIAEPEQTASIMDSAREMGLAPALLYEAVIELADEGLLTAGCLNAAAGVLLGELGLPRYFFRTLTKEALKPVLRAIGMNLQREGSRFVLRGAVAQVQFDVGGVQARIATAQTRDAMEAVLNAVMNQRRIEYYFSPHRRYYTYIIRPEMCRRLAELGPGESPFAFAQLPPALQIPDATRQRYEGFLRRCAASVTPIVEVTDSLDTDETRIMFQEDFQRSILPVVRRLIEDEGLCLNRAYWETFRTPTDRVDSICSVYIRGKPTAAKVGKVVAGLRALLAIQPNELDALYVDGRLALREYVFALCAFAFVHTFVHKGQGVDHEIIGSLMRPDLRDAMARRVFDSNRSEYTRKVILETMRQRPDLLKALFRLFDERFNPRRRRRMTARGLARRVEEFRRRIAIAFIDDTTGHDIFAFMCRLATETRRTNFYMERKRSYSFRLTPAVLDPVVFSRPVHGVFFVAGFYAIGTHMRAEDVARGGLRLIRVTPGNYETELDNMPILNYALGPVAQHLKHKDIAEGGAKGVIVPGVEYARDGLNAVLDYTEGVLDLIQPSPELVDDLGRPEMIFFGPDEGTAQFMDAVARRAAERGYAYWRTITTGKSIGIPHDTYGLTTDRKVFGLISRGEAGVEAQVEDEPPLLTRDVDEVFRRLGDRMDTSGMTTMGIMASLRVLLDHAGRREEDVRLMMTGGPDGDLGANQIQSFRGRICLLIDGGSVLFDPDGLDRKELVKIALARHTSPRLNSMAYPLERLGARGFRVPRATGAFALPDGTRVDDGAFFHRGFLADPANRRFIEQAGIQAFVPCGGFKDTINGGNARAFLGLCRELRVIVEGANVFFDDAAREIIARESGILQVKDSSANKGGVTCSSIAEVLAAFLLGEDYEKAMVQDAAFRAEMIRAVFDLISANAVAETWMLLELHRREGAPLCRLSVRTSEQLYALRDALRGHLDRILRCRDIVEGALRACVPGVLLDRLGMARTRRILDRPELQAYRDALLTKKLAALAVYRHAAEWDDFMRRIEHDLEQSLRSLVTEG